MYAKGDVVKIVDESMLPAESSRLFKHYPNGVRVVVTDVFYGFVSSIMLSLDELIEIKIRGGKEVGKDWGRGEIKSLANFKKYKNRKTPNR